MGGDASENGDFHREKQRLQGTNVFAGAFILYSERNEQLGGDASENDDFQRERNNVCRGTIFSGTDNDFLF